MFCHSSLQNLSVRTDGRIVSSSWCSRTYTELSLSHSFIVFVIILLEGKALAQSEVWAHGKRFLIKDTAVNQLPFYPHNMMLSPSCFPNKTELWRWWNWGQNVHSSFHHTILLGVFSNCQQAFMCLSLRKASICLFCHKPRLVLFCSDAWPPLTWPLELSWRNHHVLGHLSYLHPSLLSRSPKSRGCSKLLY